MGRRGIIWITWERQRRSVTLAAHLGARLYALLNRSDDIRSRVLRYAYLLPKTFSILLRERPAVCCCQNPSLALALLLGLARPLFRYTLVVDRHSNFNLGGKTGLKWRIFERLSNLSLRLADVTIVTNDALAGRVRSVGGRARVLQDRIPALYEGTRVTLEGRYNVVFVCSFGSDEPTAEVLEAAAGLGDEWRIYITGNFRRHLGRLPALQQPPSNVRLTGFLGEDEYQTLLRSADVVLVLTKHDHTLTCGAYEAVALGKPVVASGTEAMRGYFRRGILFTDNSPDSIRETLRVAVESRETLEKEIRRLRQDLDADWKARFSQLCSRLKLDAGAHRIQRKLRATFDT